MTRILPAFLLVLAAPLGAAPAPQAGPEDFLFTVAQERGWERLPDLEGRWTLYSTVSPELARETYHAIREMYMRMDELFGRTSGETQSPVGGHVTLGFFSRESDVAAACEAVAAKWVHLGQWCDQVKSFPRVHHWNPLLAFVRHDESTRKVLHPEVQLAHMSVQMEIVRRYGRVPFWVGEALGYALQDEYLGGVYGYSYRTSGEMDAEYHQGWRWGAKEAFAYSPPTVGELSAGSGQDFKQSRAYLLMGLARYWLTASPEKIRTLLENFASSRDAQWALELDYEPDPQMQARILAKAFGEGMLAAATDWWGNASSEGGPLARQNAIYGALAKVKAKHKLKEYKSRDGRVVVFSDMPSSQARRALTLSEKILKKLDKALGKPENPEEARIGALMITDEEAYHDVCDAIAEADSAQAEEMERFKTAGGFTLYKPPVTCYFHDVKVQEEAQPDHSVAHNLVHMELSRRYGILPLWLAEGLACAGEDIADGSVYANWNRDGFVFSASHSAWRQEASRLMGGQGSYSFRDLYRYSARPYREDPAHAAFAFAVYGLEADPKGLAKLLDLLRAEYRTKWTTGGAFRPEADRMAVLAQEAFGPDFEPKFRKFWEKPPKRKK